MEVDDSFNETGQPTDNSTDVDVDAEFEDSFNEDHSVDNSTDVDVEDNVVLEEAEATEVETQRPQHTRRGPVGNPSHRAVVCVY